MKGAIVVVFCLLLGGFAHVSFGDICKSLNSPDDIVPCGSKTISKDSCLVLGCCWNGTVLEKAKNVENLKNVYCYRSKRLNGTCIRYPEDGLCFPYLNNSVPQFRTALRFIDYNYGLNNTNKLLAGFQKLVTIIGKDDISKSCLRKIRMLLCQYILTPCSEDGIPIHICRRDCDMFEVQCPKTLQKLIGGARVSLHASNADFVHIALPDCNNLHYIEDLEKEGKTCYISGLFNVSAYSPVPPITPIPDNKRSSTNNVSSVKSDANNKTPIIAAGVAVTVVVVIIICLIIMFLLFRRRRDRKNEHAKLDPGTPSMNIRGLGNFPSVSVKDHINNLCADDLLKSKISINDPKQMKQYSVEMIAYEKDLGEGQFGQVFQGRAVGLNDNEPEVEVIVAVKTLKKGSSVEAKADFDQEACLMNFLSHPNIVHLLAVSAMEEPYCMIFEFMSNGDLCEYLRKSLPLIEGQTETTDPKKHYLSQEALVKMSVDVAQGLQYLASHRLIHRDVATRNCLVADDLSIKIADFGMSRDIYSNNYYKIEKETVLPIRWLSPEAVMFGKFTVASDIYSYGVLLWEIFTFSMQPYYGYTNKEVLEFIAKGIHLAKPDFCPQLVYRIMKDCWAKESELRPYYTTIIDRLHGNEVTYDTPRAWPSNTQQDSDLYQNVSLHQNGVDEDSENSYGHDDPLISIKVNNDAKNAVFMANNPLYKTANRNSSEGDSQGSINTAADSDREAEDVSVTQEDIKYVGKGQQNADQEDTSHDRNKTYV